MTPEQIEAHIAWIERQCMAAAKISVNDPSHEERMMATGRAQAHRINANRLRAALADARTS